MKKLLLSLITLTMLAAIAAASLLLYIRPSEPLNLDYEPLSLRAKALEMARQRTTKLTLTEADVHNLAVERLASDPWIGPDLEATGARFELGPNDTLLADVNVRWKGRFTAGLRITYRLSWNAPNLTAQAVEVKVKGIGLPADAAPDFVVPVGKELPELLRIRSLDIGDDGLTVTFRMPNLQELSKLLD